MSGNFGPAQRVSGNHVQFNVCQRATIIIIVEVFLKHKIFSPETVLRARTHTHTHTHARTHARTHAHTHTAISIMQPYKTACVFSLSFGPNIVRSGIMNR